MSDFAILFVDDEPYILSTMQRVFRKSPYKVLTASSGEEAVEIMEQQRVDVLITDQKMPKMSGVELCHRVKELYPATIRIIISGYADVGALLAAINQGEVYRFLEKPFDMVRLREIVDRAVEQVRVIRAFHLVVEQMDQEGAPFSYEVDYTGNMIEIGLEGEGYPLSEEKISRILQCLMEWPGARQDLKVISAVLARQNGIMTIHLDFEAGMHLAVLLPIEDKETLHEQ